MPKELQVVLTQTFDQLPLATLRNLPGPDADLRPNQLRRLAAALLAVADACEALPMEQRRFMRVTRSYALDDEPLPPPPMETPGALLTPED